MKIVISMMTILALLLAKSETAAVLHSEAATLHSEAAALAAAEAAALAAAEAAALARAKETKEYFDSLGPPTLLGELQREETSSCRSIIVTQTFALASLPVPAPL
eukprot:GHVU01021455.1.p2 GENE.GHVU01021455.1~~GHVU01021455.1.p2  ORF type:complete len:105 (+),score=25.78 GHVU01021455.1:241-555(+)